MFSWGKRSLYHRHRIHPSLRELVDGVLEVTPFDVSLTDSIRGKEMQDQYYAWGSTKLKYPMSKHNRVPSWAVHIDPYPINYENHLLYYVLAGVVLTVAEKIGMTDQLVWGGDWNQDLDLNETFRDLAHWELKYLDDKGEEDG
jgi:peptidoglycan L-alanyl-D-glutamate endopeptidase CwlK